MSRSVIIVKKREKKFFFFDVTFSNIIYNSSFYPDVRIRNLFCIHNNTPSSSRFTFVFIELLSLFCLGFIIVSTIFFRHHCLNSNSRNCRLNLDSSLLFFSSSSVFRLVLFSFFFFPSKKKIRIPVSRDFPSLVRSRVENKTRSIFIKGNI